MRERTTRELRVLLSSFLCARAVDSLCCAIHMEQLTRKSRWGVQFVSHKNEEYDERTQLNVSSLVVLWCLYINDAHRILKLTNKI